MQGPGCHPSTRRKKREKKVVPSRLGNKSCIQKAHITHKTPGCRVIFKGFPICQKPQLRTRWQWRLHFQHQETLDSQGLPGMGTGDPPRTTAPSTWPLQTLRSLLWPSPAPDGVERLGAVGVEGRVSSVVTRHRKLGSRLQPYPTWSGTKGTSRVAPAATLSQIRRWPRAGSCHNTVLGFPEPVGYHCPPTITISNLGSPGVLHQLLQSQQATCHMPQMVNHKLLLEPETTTLPCFIFN
jgi:hypothetical protein